MSITKTQSGLAAIVLIVAFTAIPGIQPGLALGAGWLLYQTFSSS